VQEYIPEFVGEGKDRVMVHQLFTHTSGLTDGPLEEVIEAYEEGSIDSTEIDESLHPYVHRILSLGYGLPLTNQPGEVMEYSSFGIYLIAEITRRLSGMSLNAFGRTPVTVCLKTSIPGIVFDLRMLPILFITRKIFSRDRLRPEGDFQQPWTWPSLDRCS
jgi:hypothetical protein